MVSVPALAFWKRSVKSPTGTFWPASRNRPLEPAVSSQYCRATMPLVVGSTHWLSASAPPAATSPAAMNTAEVRSREIVPACMASNSLSVPSRPNANSTASTSAMGSVCSMAVGSCSASHPVSRRIGVPTTHCSLGIVVLMTARPAYSRSPKSSGGTLSRSR